MEGSLKNKGLVYPQQLNLTAWLDYLDHRVKAKYKKLTDKGEKLKIEWLIAQGDYEIQQAIVNQTISNGWQGLFELKGGVNGQKSSADRRAEVGEHIERQGRQAAQELADSQGTIR